MVKASTNLRFTTLVVTPPELASGAGRGSFVLVAEVFIGDHHLFR
jgi:hypothetical protein